MSILRLHFFFREQLSCLRGSNRKIIQLDIVQRGIGIRPVLRPEFRPAAERQAQFSTESDRLIRRTADQRGRFLFDGIDIHGDIIFGFIAGDDYLLPLRGFRKHIVHDDVLPAPEIQPQLIAATGHTESVAVTRGGNNIVFVGICGLIHFYIESQRKRRKFVGNILSFPEIAGIQEIVVFQRQGAVRYFIIGRIRIFENQIDISHRICPYVRGIGKIPCCNRIGVIGGRFFSRKIIRVIFGNLCDFRIVNRPRINADVRQVGIDDRTVFKFRTDMSVVPSAQMRLSADGKSVSFMSAEGNGAGQRMGLAKCPVLVSFLGRRHREGKRLLVIHAINPVPGKIAVQHLFPVAVLIVGAEVLFLSATKIHTNSAIHPVHREIRTIRTGRNQVVSSAVVFPEINANAYRIATFHEIGKIGVLIPGYFSDRRRVQESVVFQCDAAVYGIDGHVFRNQIVVAQRIFSQVCLILKLIMRKGIKPRFRSNDIRRCFRFCILQ